MTEEVEDLTRRLMDGDRRALARAITSIEDDAPEASKIIREVYPKTGKAKIIGITGAPGTGKSTIIDGIVDVLIEEGLEVGIIAVDPSSPFTGGALLGDRIRMRGRGSEGGAFFRSMGSRGALGGLSLATSDAAKVMDAFGMDFVFIETLGVGHDVEVAKIADTCVVVLMPGAGDEIQTMKAGILEIGDIFVINKADLEGSDETARQIEAMIEMSEERSREGGEGWRPPVLMSMAKDGEGVEEIIDSVKKHLDYLRESGKLESNRKDRMREELIDLVRTRLAERIAKQAESNERLEELASEVSIERRMDPRTAAEELISKLDL